MSKDVFNQLAIQLSRVIPHEAWKIIQEFATQEIANSKNSSLFSLSFAIALWTASGAISTTMMALDLIQQIPPNERRTFWQAKFSFAVLNNWSHFPTNSSFLSRVYKRFSSKHDSSRSSLFIIFITHLAIVTVACSFGYHC